MTFNVGGSAVSGHILPAGSEFDDMVNLHSLSAFNWKVTETTNSLGVIEALLPVASGKAAAVAHDAFLRLRIATRKTACS